MPITFDGVGSQWEPSAAYRQRIADSGEKVILSFSRGKDSIAAWLAMLDSGIKPEQIVPVYYYRIPGELRFANESLAYYEETFETRIHRLPHPSLYHQLAIGLYWPIERTWIIPAVGIPEPTYQDIEAAFREDQGLPPDTMVATGVRAADGISRRTYLKKSGPYSTAKKRLAIIWDWTIDECYETIERHGVRLPPDYEWFAKINPRTGKPVKRSGRTFDGLAYQFLKPLSIHAPDDYARVLEWFPLAELEIIRHEHL